MEEFDKNIDNVRRNLKEMKCEKYAILNSVIMQEEEYVKSLYLEVLGTVMYYKNIPNEAQIVYLKRIAAGMFMELTFEEYMKKALEISSVDLEEFINTVKESELKYYFALNAIILVSLADCDKSCYEYVAEIVELTDVDCSELKYLSKLAGSIVQRESELYDEARDCIPESVIDDANFFFLDLYGQFLSSYYTGMLVNMPGMKSFYSYDKKMVYELNGGMKFNENIVSFDNLTIEVNDDWWFEGCMTVTFKNCIINCKNGNFKFKNVDSIFIENCEFMNFNDRVAVMENVVEVEVKGSKFIDCGYDAKNREYEIFGGVMIIYEGDCSQIIIKNNEIFRAYNARHFSGLFIWHKNRVGYLEVVNNKFIDVEEYREHGRDCEYCSMICCSGWNNKEEYENYVNGEKICVLE